MPFEKKLFKHFVAIIILIVSFFFIWLLVIGQPPNHQQPDQASSNNKSSSENRLNEGEVVRSYSDGVEDIRFISGTFQGWEEIANSKDRYLTIASRGEKYQIRIGYEPSPLLDGTTNLTDLAKPLENDRVEVIGKFSSFNSDEINSLIKNQGYIKANLLLDSSGKTRRDDSQNPVAVRITIYDL